LKQQYQAVGGIYLGAFVGNSPACADVVDQLVGLFASGCGLKLVPASLWEQQALEEVRHKFYEVLQRVLVKQFAEDAHETLNHPIHR